MVPAPIATRIVGGGRRLIRSADRTLFPEATEPAEHWQRIVMNDAVGELIRDLGPSSLSAAEISGDNHVSRPWKTYTSLDYPAFDICAPLQGSETYDVVICEQVLEHVVDPRAAARNLRALCSPGRLGDCLDPVSDPRPRIADVRAQGLLAIHPPGPTVAAYRRWFQQRRGSFLGEPRVHPREHEPLGPVPPLDAVAQRSRSARAGLGLRQAIAMSAGSGTSNSGPQSELVHHDPRQLWFQIAEIFNERTYVQHGVDVTRGDVVFDLGANVGVAATFFASVCHARRVYSFEPIEPIFELLRENTRTLPRLHLEDARDRQQVRKS